MSYLKAKGIKMRSVDVDNNKEIDLSDEGGAESEEDSEEPKKKKRQ